MNAEKCFLSVLRREGGLSECLSSSSSLLPWLLLTSSSPSFAAVFLGDDDRDRVLTFGPGCSFTAYRGQSYRLDDRLAGLSVVPSPSVPIITYLLFSTADGR